MRSEKTIGAWKVEALVVLRRLCCWRDVFTVEDLRVCIPGVPAELDLGETVQVGVKARWCCRNGDAFESLLRNPRNPVRGT